MAAVRIGKSRTRTRTRAPEAGKEINISTSDRTIAATNQTNKAEARKYGNE